MVNLEKYQIVIMLAAMGIGLGLGQFSIFEDNAGSFVTPFLFIMLFGAFLNIPLGEYKNALKNVRFSSTVVLINFIWTPILVWGLASLFLDDPIMQIGFIMLMVTPCTDWYLVFTANAKGNVPLSASVLPFNLLLQVILLPVFLFLFAGVNGTVDMSDLLKSIMIMLVLPFTLAQVTKYLLNRSKREGLKEKVTGAFSSSGTIFLGLAIMAMFAAKGNDLVSNMDVVLLLLLPIAAFYIINFVLAQLVSRKFKYSYADTASLTLTTIAKNSPMTLGIALIAFPDQPIIHLIMVIEPLIELPVMVCITRILLYMKKRREAAEASPT